MYKEINGGEGPKIGGVTLLCGNKKRTFLQLSTKQGLPGKLLQHYLQACATTTWIHLAFPHLSYIFLK